MTHLKKYTWEQRQFELWSQEILSNFCPFYVIIFPSNGNPPLIIFAAFCAPNLSSHPYVMLHVHHRHLFAGFPNLWKYKKWLFQNTFVFLSYCALALTELTAYISLCQLWSKTHVASSTCHSPLFEVFRVRVCVCVRYVWNVRQGIEDESVRTICCCWLRMEWWVVT